MWSTPRTLSWLLGLSTATVGQCLVSVTATMVNIQAACNELSQVLPSKAVSPNHTEYATIEASYFSLLEQEIAPACILTPESSDDVALAVKTLVSHGVEFAVRGGGHTLNAGAANIQNGVTIDLRRLNKTTLNDDKSIASIGGGSQWAEVYRTLDPLNLTVAGGRAGDVGVGGLTLGGGISWFSGTQGLVCDNVENYEVVLADGKIVTANSTENRDLWLALKGGSNNFGIVTRFDVRTWKQDEFYGGVVVAPITTADAQLRAIANGAINYDPHSAFIISFSWNQTGNRYAIFSNLQYTTADTAAAALQPFTTVQPQLVNTMRISNATDFAVETARYAAPGLRNQFATTTFKATLPMVQQVYQLWNDSISGVSDVECLNWALVLQPFPAAFLAAGQQHGGDSLGITPADGNHVLVLLSYTWKNRTDDDRLYAAAQKLFADIDAASATAGVSSPFKYLNYAAAWQDPLAGYGTANLDRLKKVAETYDPNGVFQKQCPGGFKLSKA